jgi:hypothetical protein
VVIKSSIANLNTPLIINVQDKRYSQSKYHIPVSKLKPKGLEDIRKPSMPSNGVINNYQNQYFASENTPIQMIIDQQNPVQTEFESLKLSQSSDDDISGYKAKQLVQMPILLQHSSADVSLLQSPSVPEWLRVGLKNNNSFKTKQKKRRNMARDSRDQYKQYLSMLRDQENNQLKKLMNIEKVRANSYENIAVHQNSSHHILLDNVPQYESDEAKNLMNQLHLRKKMMIQTEQDSLQLSPKPKLNSKIYETHDGMTSALRNFVEKENGVQVIREEFDLLAIDR